MPSNISFANITKSNNHRFNTNTTKRKLPVDCKHNALTRAEFGVIAGRNMNYTRKRALLACDFCRHRKRRCDGQKPCSTCRDSNADCVYKELPYDRIEDASPAAVADRLARIEALLEQQGQQLRQMTSSSTPTSSSAVPFDYTQSSSPVFSKFSEFNEMPSFPQEQVETPTFLIPKGHTNLTTTILAMPQLREHLGEFPRDYFYKIEENQPLPESLRSSQVDRRAWPPLRQAIVTKLSESYFRNVHSRQPLLNPSTFQLWQSKLLKKEPIADAEAAICLLVYALGAVTTPVAANPHTSDGVLGLAFFRPALALILHDYTWNFKPDLAVVQGLLLAGSYFLHLGRPLHSWRMSYLASQRFLQTIELYSRRGEDTDVEYHEAELRVFWQCFQEDCNRAEDLDVLRSGIEPLGDKMPLPHSMDPSDHEETIHLFAEIAIRRLLNRVHSSLYNPETDNLFPRMLDPTTSRQGLSLQKLLTLSSELDRQLEEWYVSIPDVIRPPRGIEPILNERGCKLRIRYYAARHIIHRPFVLYAAAQQSRGTSLSSAQTSPGRAVPPSHSPPPAADGLLPQVVVEKCEVCIESSVTYLYNTIEKLDQRSSCLWTASQSCLACFLVLLLAESCPQLRRFVPPMRTLQKTAIDKLEKWAVESSSFEAVVAIMKRLVFREA